MEFEEFKRRIKIIQKAMVERGISEDNDFGVWCNYRDPAVSIVFQKTIGCRNGARAWRTPGELNVLFGFVKQVSILNGHSNRMRNSLMQRLKNSVASMTLWTLFRQMFMVSLS